MNIEQYLHGDCHIFAMALHLEFGYQIQLAIDKFDLDTESEVLIHAYCVHQEKAIHASGKVDLEKILDDYDYNDEYFVNVSKEVLENLVNTGFLHAPTEKQIENIREYIRQNKNKFE